MCIRDSALIVGTGNSGHDVAQDLDGHGAHATLIQRRPTTIVSVEPSGQLVYGLYKEGPPTQDCDLIVTSIPFPLLKRTYQLIVKESRKHDHELLENSPPPVSRWMTAQKTPDSR